MRADHLMEVKKICIRARPNVEKERVHRSENRSESAQALDSERFAPRRVALRQDASISHLPPQIEARFGWMLRTLVDPADMFVVGGVGKREFRRSDPARRARVST